MDICRDFSVSGGLQYQQQQPEYQLGSLDDLFSGHPLEEESDVHMEWLSTFVEECFSSTGNCLLPPISATQTQTQPFQQQQKQLMKPTPNKQTQQSFGNLQFDKVVIPVKGTRTKRKRSQSRKIKPSWWFPPPQSDPPLLQQSYWSADSKLILPQKKQHNDEQEEQELEAVVSRQERRKKKKKEVKKQSHNDNSSDLMMEEEEEGSSNNGIRKCTHCLSQRTPQWRAGPMGPKTLCNACGVRYKSGRLLPEYRPAKSPSFVSYMHSNSHKKVLEMRTLSYRDDHLRFQFEPDREHTVYGYSSKPVLTVPV